MNTISSLTKRCACVTWLLAGIYEVSEVKDYLAERGIIVRMGWDSIVNISTQSADFDFFNHLTILTQP